MRYVAYAFLSAFPLSSHPKSIDSSRHIVPGDGQRKQRTSQSGVDAVVEYVLVGVVVGKGNAADKHSSAAAH